MTNRMDNLQIVFDRTDWNDLRHMRNALDQTIERRGPDTLKSLVEWLDSLIIAAKMDGYRMKEPTR